MIIGGRGGNRRTTAWRPGKNNFAPRLGAVYRLNDKTVVRRRLRHHLQRAAVGARAARRQRLPGDGRLDLHQHRTSSPVGTAGAGDSAARRSATRAAGACALPTRPSSTRRRSATSIAARSRRGTSRSSAGCRWTSPSMSRTSARRGTAAMAGSTSMRRRRSASATPAGRMPRWAASSRCVVGPASCRTRYNSMQVALNKPFTEGSCSRARTR